MKIFTTVFICLITIPEALFAHETVKYLSVEQAEFLARTAANETGIAKLKGFSLERAQLDEFPDFYFFDALVSEPGAEGFSGHYAVNKYNGDVWNPYRCSRFSGKNLIKIQKKIKKEIGLKTEKQSPNFKDNPPCLAGN
jgi:hypothetical protein